MWTKLRSITPLLGLTAAAMVISAPIASASTSLAPPQQACVSSGAGTICQSPGNAQINDSRPPVQFYPYGGEAFLL
ncbi:hypothetical protein ABIA30_005325 [Mycobacterium sp. MAA66]|uniref:hypothetical protein n=1 Tax=Mycobacterium sp. MAA66 TaxID=3156297 RepID=UPI003516A40E